MKTRIASNVCILLGLFLLFAANAASLSIPDPNKILLEEHRIGLQDVSIIRSLEAGFLILLFTGSPVLLVTLAGFGGNPGKSIGDTLENFIPGLYKVVRINDSRQLLDFNVKYPLVFAVIPTITLILWPDIIGAAYLITIPPMIIIGLYAAIINAIKNPDYPLVKIPQKFFVKGRGNAELMDYLTTFILIVLTSALGFLLFFWDDSRAATPNGFPGLAFVGRIAIMVFLYFIVSLLIEGIFLAGYSVYLTFMNIDKALSLHYLLGFFALNVVYAVKEPSSGPSMPIFTLVFLFAPFLLLLFIFLIRQPAIKNSRDARLSAGSFVSEICAFGMLFSLYILYPLTLIYSMINKTVDPLVGVFLITHSIKYIFLGAGIITASKDLRIMLDETRNFLGNKTRLFSTATFSVLFNSACVAVMGANIDAGRSLYAFSSIFWSFWKRIFNNNRDAQVVS